jgi:flagellar operon protein
MNIEHLTGRIQPGLPPSGKPAKLPDSGVKPQGESFSSVLNRVAGSDEPQKLSFSAHAIKRLQDRSIELNNGDVERIGAAVARAEQKGSRESLVLDGNQAFIVNVPNKTIITAMDVMEMRERVFTNIDSTVFTNK